ncbi:MAG: hypothetical protein AAFX52_08710 [Pseudomonadota bacterium]
MELESIDHDEATLCALDCYVKTTMDCPEWFSFALAKDLQYRAIGIGNVLHDLRRYLDELALPELSASQWIAVTIRVQDAVLEMHAQIHPPAEHVIQDVRRYLDGGVMSSQMRQDIANHLTAATYARSIYEATPLDHPEALYAFTLAHQVCESLPTWLAPGLTLPVLLQIRTLIENALSDVLGGDWDRPLRVPQAGTETLQASLAEAA